MRAYYSTKILMRGVSSHCSQYGIIYMHLVHKCRQVDKQSSRNMYFPSTLFCTYHYVGFAFFPTFVMRLRSCVPPLISLQHKHDISYTVKFHEDGNILEAGNGTFDRDKQLGRISGAASMLILKLPSRTYLYVSVKRKKKTRVVNQSIYWISRRYGNI